LAFLAAALAGCKRNDIQVYRVSKEDPAAEATRAGKEDSPGQPSLPAGWQELPPDQMRVGNYAIAGANGAKAQVTIIPLPGTAGSELDNVNRWRGQIGLGPTTEDQLASQAKQVQLAGAPVRLFDLSGKDPKAQSPTRILAAVQPHGDSQWFFKMMGDDELVRQQKDAFISFLASYQYPDPNAAKPVESAAVPAKSEIPQAHPPMHHWAVPAGWEQQSPGPMQDAKFAIGGRKATVAVSIFEGTTGGTLANVNRWRAQVGLPPVEEGGLGLTTIDLPDTKASLVDLKGPQQRMVAAIVPRGGSTWFFKLLGEDATVGAEKEKFIQFVKGSK
jgi:hypothetical protein